MKKLYEMPLSSDLCRQSAALVDMTDYFNEFVKNQSTPCLWDLEMSPKLDMGKDISTFKQSTRWSCVNLVA